MASGFAPGAIGQPVQTSSALKPKKPTVLGQPAPMAPPLTVGQPAASGVSPVAKSPLTETMQTLGGAGATPVAKPPLTETVPTLGGVVGQPVSGAPVGSAPLTGKAPPSLEDRLTGAVSAGDPRLTNTQGLVNNAAQGLANGPDRTAIAKQAFTDFLSQSNDQFGKDVRNITQRNAAAGRLGSGMYGSDLVDAATAADKNRAYAGNQLAQDLANGTISDQFGRLSALSGLEGQQFGQGQTALNNLFGYGQNQFQNQLATQQQQQSLDQQQFNQLLALLGLQG